MAGYKGDYSGAAALRLPQQREKVGRFGKEQKESLRGQNVCAGFMLRIKWCESRRGQPWRIAAMTSCSILPSCSAEGLYACLIAGRRASHLEPANAS